MPFVILNHTVKDYKIWRPHFDMDIDRRLKGGFRNENVYQDANDPNLVYVTWEMDDIVALDLLLNDPDLEDAMKAAGVTSKPIVTILKET